MTIFTSIILVVAIILVALFIAYQVQKGSKTLEEMRANYYENEEIQEVVELTQELYNKDLRPIVAKKAPKTVEAVTVEAVLEPAKPKKKRKYYPKKPKTSI